MTDLQYDFLSRYKKSGYPLPGQLSYPDRGFLKICRELKFIKQVTLPDGSWCYRISELGEAMMLEFENKLEKAAEEHAKAEAEQSAQEQMTQERWRKDAGRSWLQFWLNALFGVIGCAAGVLIEHYFAILDLLLALL